MEFYFAPMEGVAGYIYRNTYNKYFDNIDQIKNASIEELKKLPSMNEKSAQNVYDFFH